MISFILLTLRIFFSVCGLLFTLLTNAQAYLDPGTGSMLLQLLLASLAGIGYSCVAYWHRIVAFFTNKKKTSDANQTNSTEEQNIDEKSS